MKKGSMGTQGPKYPSNCPKINHKIFIFSDSMKIPEPTSNLKLIFENSIEEVCKCSKIV